jgi:hypothetical protein
MTHNQPHTALTFGEREKKYVLSPSAKSDMRIILMSATKQELQVCSNHVPSGERATFWVDDTGKQHRLHAGQPVQQRHLQIQI